MGDLPDLCPDHEHAAAQCLAKNGHHPDSDTGMQLRAQLAMACTPGRHCPPLEPKEIA